MATRYFEFKDGSSNKFWEVWVDGTQVFTRFGKIGAKGQLTVKEAGAGAQALHDQLVRQKTGKGYVERGAAAPATTGFRRFEHTTSGSNKFWEVRVEGKVQTVRFGAIGTKGREKTEEFENRREANDVTNDLITQKLKKGYVELGVRAKATSSPELLAIAERLDDPNAYLVYADALQDRHDPQGELIALQVRAQTEQDATKAASFAQQAVAHLKKHKAAILGAASRWPSGSSERHLKLDWRFGFIERADFGGDSFDDDDEADDVGEVLKQLLELPAARFIRALSLGPAPGFDEMSMRPFVEAIAIAKPFALRELYLGNVGRWDLSSTSTGNFGEIARACPALEKVTLHAGHIGFEKGLSLPALRELALQTGGLNRNTVKNLSTLKAPRLERLELWFGAEDYGGDCVLKDIQWVLDGVGLGAVKHLGLMNCGFAHDVVAALPRSKILKQLRTLDLSMSCVSDADVTFLAKHQAAFAHLAYLNLDDNALTAASKPKVKGLANEVNFGKTHHPRRAQGDRYRFVSVTE